MLHDALQRVEQQHDRTLLKAAAMRRKQLPSSLGIEKTCYVQKYISRLKRQGRGFSKDVGFQ